MQDCPQTSSFRVALMNLVRLSEAAGPLAVVVIIIIIIIIKRISRAPISEAKIMNT